mgnify:CR=1 FL=1
MTLLILLAVGATAALSGVFGMAGGMILIALLALLLPIPEAMVVHALAQGFANGARAGLLWRAIRWRGLGTYALGVLLTVALVQWVAWVPSKGILLLLLGATPFLALALPSRFALHFEHRLHSFFAGLFVTGGQLFAGASGPLLDSFFLRGNQSREATVATKGFAQCLGHGAKLGVYGPLLWQQEGASTLSWPLLLALGPVAILGTVAGTRLLKRWSDGAFNRWSRRLVQGLGLIAMSSGVLILLSP